MEGIARQYNPGVLILLPPSEGKTAPATGPSLDLGTLSFPALSPARDQVLSALIAASERPDACATLGVSPGLAATVEANRWLRIAPTAPALSVYSGVLYDALAPASWDPDTHIRAQGSMLIFSALFGVVGPTDPIPSYRLSGGANLPGLGRLSGFWKRHLGPVLPDDDLVIDCRSGTYAAMWRPQASLPVRVFDESSGTRKVVSHMAKHARGLVARALVSGPAPTGATDAVCLLNSYFATHPVTTAAGLPVRVSVEHGNDSIDVVTAASPR